MKRATRLCAAAVLMVNPRCVHPHPEMLQGISLDNATSETEWTIGRAFTTEQAIAYALSDED